MPAPAIAAPQSTPERRAHERRSVNHRGLLGFEDGSEPVPCRLVNLSAGGALVSVDGGETLPQRVSLFYDRLDEQLPEVVSAWCEVVRREAKCAALRFLAPVGETIITSQ